MIFKEIDVFAVTKKGWKLPPPKQMFLFVVRCLLSNTTMPYSCLGYAYVN